MAAHREPGERETPVYVPAIGNPAGALVSEPPPGTTGPRFRR
jgi:hypothetical protein